MQPKVDSVRKNQALTTTTTSMHPDVDRIRGRASSGFAREKRHDQHH